MAGGAPCAVRCGLADAGAPPPRGGGGGCRCWSGASDPSSLTDERLYHPLPRSPREHEGRENRRCGRPSLAPPTTIRSARVVAVLPPLSASPRTKAASAEVGAVCCRGAATLKEPPSADDRHLTAVTAPRGECPLKTAEMRGKAKGPAGTRRRASVDWPPRPPSTAHSPRTNEEPPRRFAEGEKGSGPRKRLVE